MAECIILKGGGGADLDVITAESSDVLAGKVFVDKNGEPLPGTLALSGDVSNDQVLAGRSYYSTNPKNKQMGSMPNYSITPTAIDAIRINNNRFEVAVARGFHGYNWAGGGYEYMSYDQVANAIGLTPNKLKKGEWVCGRTGTFEGWVGVDTDLYYNGNNKAGFILAGGNSFSDGSLETGMIWLKFGGNHNLYLRPSMSYNLSLYSKINFYFMAETNWSTGYVFQLEDYPNITTTITNIAAGNYYTATLNIVGLNATILPQILMWAFGSGGSGSYRCRIYLYRIYLS